MTNSLQSLSTKQRFALWARDAKLVDLKDALTALNLVYQSRKELTMHENQQKQMRELLASLPDARSATTIRTYQAEDDSPIDEQQLMMWLVEAWAYQTKMDFSLYYQKVKREVRKNHYGKLCPECGVKMSSPKDNNSRSLTIDHIIPVWVCKAVDYWHGIVDPKNMRVMCATCNSKRGDKLATIADIRKDLGDKYVDAFFKKVNTYLPSTFTHIV